MHLLSDHTHGFRHDLGDKVDFYLSFLSATLWQTFQVI